MIGFFLYIACLHCSNIQTKIIFSLTKKHELKEETIIKYLQDKPMSKLTIDYKQFIDEFFSGREDEIKALHGERFFQRVGELYCEYFINYIKNEIWNDFPVLNITFDQDNPLFESFHTEDLMKIFEGIRFYESFNSLKFYYDYCRANKNYFTFQVQSIISKILKKLREIPVLYEELCSTIDFNLIYKPLINSESVRNQLSESVKLGRVEYFYLDCSDSLVDLHFNEALNDITDFLLTKELKNAIVYIFFDHALFFKQTFFEYYKQHALKSYFEYRNYMKKHYEEFKNKWISNFTENIQKMDPHFLTNDAKVEFYETTQEDKEAFKKGFLTVYNYHLDTYNEFSLVFDDLTMIGSEYFGEAVTRLKSITDK